MPKNAYNTKDENKAMSFAAENFTPLRKLLLSYYWTMVETEKRIMGQQETMIRIAHNELGSSILITSYVQKTHKIVCHKRDVVHIV